MPADTAGDPDGPQSKLDMLSLAQSPAIGTVDTRVVGGDMFSTTFNYTNNVFASSSRISGNPEASLGPRGHLDQKPSEKQPEEVRGLLYRLLQPLWIFPRNIGKKTSGDFSLFPLDDHPQSLTAVRTSGEIYVCSMLKSGNGLACWKPRPRKPIAEGIGILPGDVGIYTVEGGFRKIFNLWEDSSEPSSPSSRSSQTPPRTPHIEKPSSILTSEELAEGHAVVQGVSYDTIYESDERTIARFEFHHVEPHQQGSLLAMTSPGILEELEDHDKAALREHISQNAGLIYKHANRIRPISDVESLYIITGCIKSESWALAAFSDPLPQPRRPPRLIRQTHPGANNHSSRSSYVWRSPGTLAAYSGRSVGAGSADQSLFLQGFKLDFSQPFRSRTKHKLTEDEHSPKSAGDEERNTPDGGKTSGKGGPQTQGPNGTGFTLASGSAGGSGGAADTDIRVTSFADDSGRQSCHPCDIINRFLLDKTGLDFALSHDDDWRFILSSEPETWSSELGRVRVEPSTSDELARRVGEPLESNLISVKHDVASLFRYGALGHDNCLVPSTVISQSADRGPEKGASLVDDCSSEDESTVRLAPEGWDRGQRFYALPNVAIEDAPHTPPNASPEFVGHTGDTNSQEQEPTLPNEGPATTSATLVGSSAPSSSLKKKKSMCTTRESAHGRFIVATFELPREAQDVHIHFRGHRLTLEWVIQGDYEQWVDDDALLRRERTTRHFHRTIPLPDGTAFEDIHAEWTSKGLSIRYPNMRAERVTSRRASDPVRPTRGE